MGKRKINSIKDKSIIPSESNDFDNDSSENDENSSHEENSSKKKQKNIDENDHELSDSLPSSKDDSPIDPSVISDENLHRLLPKLRRLDDKDRKMLQDKNILVQSGRFTKHENSMIRRNWKRYLEDYNIPNKSLLFGHFQYERKDQNNSRIKKAYRKFADETQLWLRLAKDIPNRTVFQVYSRARILLADLKTSKDLTDKDRQIIVDLYRAHGDNFARFCEEFGYNPNTAREVIRNNIKANGEKVNHGQWSEKEVKKLKKIVRELIKELNLQSYDGIPWTVVANKLCRSSIQCRQKFFSRSTLFTMVAAESQITEWDYKLDIAKLIALMKHLNFPDFDSIDWDLIKEKFSTDYFNVILRKWRELRVRIPNHHDLSLSEVLDYLYKKRVLKPFGSDEDKMKEIEKFVSS